MCIGVSFKCWYVRCVINTYCIYMCVCVCIYIYIHTYIYTCILYLIESGLHFRLLLRLAVGDFAPIMLHLVW